MYMLYMDLYRVVCYIIVQVEKDTPELEVNTGRRLAMAERSDALKKAQQKYMEKFAVARVRMEREKYEAVQAYADAQGMSVNALVVDLLDRRMSHDADDPQDTVLTPAALETIQAAVSATGETIPQFVERAVETQARADGHFKEARKYMHL